MSPSINYFVLFVIMRQMWVICITSETWTKKIESINKLITLLTARLTSPKLFIRTEVHLFPELIITKLEDSHSRCSNVFPELNYVLCDYTLPHASMRKRREYIEQNSTTGSGSILKSTFKHNHPKIFHKTTYDN